VITPAQLEKLRPSALFDYAEVKARVEDHLKVAASNGARSITVTEGRCPVLRQYLEAVKKYRPVADWIIPSARAVFIDKLERELRDAGFTLIHHEASHDGFGLHSWPAFLEVKW